MPKEFPVDQVIARIKASRNGLDAYLGALNELVDELNRSDPTSESYKNYSKQLTALLSSPELTSEPPVPLGELNKLIYELNHSDPKSERYTTYSQKLTELLSPQLINKLFPLDNYGSYSQSILMQALANLIIKIPAEFNIDSLLAIFIVFQYQNVNNPAQNLLTQRLMYDYVTSTENGETSQCSRQKELLLLINNQNKLSPEIQSKIQREYTQFSSYLQDDGLYNKLNTLQASINAMQKKIAAIGYTHLTPMDQTICTTLQQEAQTTATLFAHAVAANPQNAALKKLNAQAKKLAQQSNFSDPNRSALSSQDFSPHAFYLMNKHEKANFLTRCTLGTPNETAENAANSILANNKLGVWDSLKAALRHPFTQGVWQAVRDARKKKSIFSAADLFQLFLAATPETILLALRNLENRAILYSDPKIAIKLGCYLQLKYTYDYHELWEAWPYHTSDSAQDPRVIVINILSHCPSGGLFQPNYMTTPIKEMLKAQLTTLLDDDTQQYDKDLFFTELLKNATYVNALFRSELFGRNPVDPLLNKLYSRQRLADPQIMNTLLRYSYPEQQASLAAQMDIVKLLGLYNQADNTRKAAIKEWIPKALAGTLNAYADNPIGQGVLIQAILAADIANLLPQLPAATNTTAVIAAPESALASAIKGIQLVVVESAAAGPAPAITGLTEKLSTPSHSSKKPSPNQLAATIASSQASRAMGGGPLTTCRQAAIQADNVLGTTVAPHTIALTT